jgi:hypothetical protein
LSLFQNALAETNIVLPPVQSGCGVEPKDVPVPELPEKRAAYLIGHAVSLVGTVAGFVPKAARTASHSLQPPVAKQAREEAVRDVRSDPIEPLSTAAIAPIDESNVVEAAALPPLNRAEAAVASPLQPVDKPASKVLLPLKLPTQIDYAHSAVVQAAPILLKAETAVPLPQQSLMNQFSPEGRLDMDSADIGRWVEPSEGEAQQKQFRTAPELAEMIELDLARHPDSPMAGFRVTVPGGSHWRAMLTITPAAGRVRNPQEWRDLTDELAEQLRKRYDLASPLP